MQSELKMIKKNEFPLSDMTTEGMRTIQLESRHDYCDIRLNIVYANKDGRDLHLEIITPPGVFPDDLTAEEPEKNYPAIMYCVGSAWFEQDMGRKLTRLEDFCKRGYVIVLVEYRPSTIAPFPAQVKDFKTATRFIQNHAKEYAIDVEHIYAWGDSSGGHTISMTNATWDAPEFNDEQEPLLIKAFVDFYGPNDFSRMNDYPSIQDHDEPDCPEGMVIGHRRISENPEWTKKADPRTYITADKKLRPQLIIHGNRDRLVHFSQSIMLYEKLRDTNQTVEFYKIEGADHAEDLFFQKPVLDIIQEFLERY